MASLFARDAGSAFNLTTRRDGCVAFDPSAKLPTYGYDPTLTAGIVFSVVFGLTMLAHLVQTIAYRKWWYSVIGIGALGELIGWIARAKAHDCPYNKTLFSIQISILIIAPCFYSAGIYYLLGQMISQYGRAYSPISPRVYLIVFITIDLISIAIQGTGGGLASSAGGKVPPADTNPGTHIIIAGIIIQLVSMSVFVALWFYFIWAARALPYSRPLAATTSFAAALILIRNFYRAVEMSQGFSGYLITHEVYFTVLDGALMALVPISFNIVFPAKYLTGVPHSQPDLTTKTADEETRGPKMADEETKEGTY